MQTAKVAWRMLKKEEQVNSSCAPVFHPCTQSWQTSSFVHWFIPLIGEPGCPLYGLVHARCSQGHGWYDSLTLTDFLPGQGWSLAQLWGDGFECQRQPWPDSRTLTHLTGNCVLVFFFFQIKQLLAVHYFRCSMCCTTPPTAVLMQLSRHMMWKKKRFPAGSRGTPLYHPITMVLRQGHDQRDSS